MGTASATTSPDTTSSATGSSATGSSATGSCVTGCSAAGCSATGCSAAGSSVTGCSATGSGIAETSGWASDTGGAVSSGAGRSGWSGRGDAGQAVPKLTTGTAVAGGTDGDDGRAGIGRWPGRSCDTSGCGAPAARPRARAGAPSIIPGTTAGGCGRGGAAGGKDGGDSWEDGSVSGPVRAAGNAGAGNAGACRPPPGPSARIFDRSVLPGAAVRVFLAGRGVRSGGCPWSRSLTATGAAIAAGGTPTLALPFPATASLARLAFTVAAIDAVVALGARTPDRWGAWRPRQTRAVTTIWSFSLSGTSLTHVRGSVRYRACDSTSSGSRLLSMTGLVVSQVSTPGGSTYSQSSV